MERRLGPFILALLLGLPVAAAEGNRFHEDPATADEDYRVLAALAERVGVETARGVEAAFAQEDKLAIERLEDAGQRARGLAEGAGVDERTATSAARLAPFAKAALVVTPNATTLARDWLSFTRYGHDELASPGRYAEALLVLAGARGALADAKPGVDALESLDVDVTRLRAALATAEEAIAQATARMEREAPRAAAGILLEARPPRLALGETLTLRGLLARPGEDVAGIAVALNVDGVAWGEAATDEHGFFHFVRVVPEDTPVGPHEAIANAVGLASAPAPFEVTRIPTTLTLAPSRGTFPPGADPTFAIRLVDAHGRGLDARVSLTNISEGVATVDLVGGRGAFTWRKAGLALGEHVLEARFEGSRTHEPSQTQVSFGVGVVRMDGGIDGAARFAFRGIEFNVALRALVVTALVLAHAWALERPWTPRALRYAGPIAVGFGGYALTDAGTGAIAGVLGAAVSVLHARARRAPATVAPPPVGPAPIPPSPRSAGEESPADAREAVATAYRRLLRDLESSGIKTGPRTPREIERILLDRGHAPTGVREITRLAERALYEGVATDDDVPAFASAAYSIGVTAE